ncbi:uncharacterized protein LOC117647940 [Thrips palmi]|uniref:Uncharacterized protein LOC117647940 n=1 Tax=Thrips palmi TaxID=161013 RepID=A0A6P8ZC27_THRPL|nr:uncharacterized protein LOC117647940 [Thrips palmi]
MGTCETAAPSQVLSCQKLEASLQMQSLQSFQPAVPLSYPTKYGLDDRILRQNEASGDAGRTTFQQPEGGLSRDFNQFGMDSEPSSYYQRHQSNTDDHFNHLTQTSMDAPVSVSHFLPQASGDPTMYQHHNQFDSTMFRQQSHSSAGAALYRQSHVPAEALPFCHQTQAPEQSAFQPSGPSSYQINSNQPQVDALLYQHQNQLPESALYQRQDAPVFHPSNQTASEPPLFHQGRPTMDAPLYHHQNQRPSENPMFREPVQPVTEGHMYHQSVPTVEASLYRNQRRADASMFHQSNQATSEASMYHHASQSGGETPVFQHQDAAMFHHPNQPLPGITPHLFHHGHNGAQQASNFFSQNQTASDGDFFRYQSQAGDSHYQRQTQTNAAYYNLQNLAAVDAQFHHQQNQAEPSFPLHQSQRSMEPAIQNPGSVDTPFYTHRGIDVDVQLASDSQMFQFQSQVPQETRIHHHSRPSAPVFPYQSQVVQETQIHQRNRTSGLSMVNYQNPTAQDSRSQTTAVDLPLLDYRSQGSQDKQLLNTKNPEVNMYQYQNQGSQDLQQSSTSSGKNTSIHYQKKSRDERLYSQNQERHQFKPHQQTFEESKQDHSKLNQFSKMPHSVPQLSTRDSQTRNGAGKARIVGCKSEQNASQFDKPRGDPYRNKAAKGMEHKSQHFNRNTVVSQWHSAEAQRLAANAPRLTGLHQETACAENPSDKPCVADENKLGHASEVQPLENVTSLESGSTESSVLDSILVHFNNESVVPANKEPTVGSLFVEVLGASEAECSDKGDTDKTASSDDCVALEVQCPKRNGQASPDNDGPIDNLDNIRHFAKDPTFPDGTDSVSQTQSVVEELLEDAHAAEVVEQPAADFEPATTEDGFSATNAHLLPRPPDILLTVPVDAGSHSSSPSHDSLAPSDDHPSTPSAQLSQEGSDESSPALVVLLDSPEVADLDLPPTPPPTPPLSPPLLTPPCVTPPPCTPPLSSAPSSPRSATPPFSSPLSTSPRSGQGEIQTLCLVPCEGSQPQPLESSSNASSDSPVVTSNDKLIDENSNSPQLDKCIEPLENLSSALLDKSVEVNSSPDESIVCSPIQEADSVPVSDALYLDHKTCDPCSPSSSAGQSELETLPIVQALPEPCAVPQDDPHSQMPPDSADLEHPSEINLRDESLISTVPADVPFVQNEDRITLDTVSESDPSQISKTEDIISVPLHLNEATTLTNSDDLFPGVIPDTILIDSDDDLPGIIPAITLTDSDDVLSSNIPTITLTDSDDVLPGTIPSITLTDSDDVLPGIISAAILTDSNDVPPCIIPAITLTDSDDVLSGIIPAATLTDSEDVLPGTIPVITFTDSEDVLPGCIPAITLTDTEDVAPETIPAIKLTDSDNDLPGIIPATTLTESGDASPGPGQEISQQDETASLPSVDAIPVDEQQGPSIRVHGFHAPRTHPLKL